MRESNAPKLNKLPFLVGDLLLLAAAYYIYYQGPLPLGPTHTAIAAGCIALGALLAAAPYLIEYSAASRLTETEVLSSTMAQFHKLETLATQISQATGSWQVAQENAEKTVSAARQVSERIAVEAKAFGEFMQRANDSEKAHLRLEVEKLRRAEGDWLQTIVRLLDHVYALYVGAVRAGQPNVVEQVGQFQRACRDLGRRIGLAPFTPEPEEAFDAEKHQLVDPKAEPEPGARIAEIIATGYTFQGRLLRPALVTLKPASGELVQPKQTELISDQ